MPSFADDIVLAILALLLFGPKKLPVLARELGKWIGEFRRASNEFKFQMEEELRQSEQAERQKQIAAMEAAAPPAPAVEAVPAAPEDIVTEPSATTATLQPEENTSDAPAEPLPIATSGSLNMMPPATGLPLARESTNPMGAVLESIPEHEEHPVEAAHGD